MAVHDSIGDMLTKIRNAVMARHTEVDIIPSKEKIEIIKILKSEGFIKNFKKIEENGKTFIRISLKYDSNKNPVIKGLKRISKPGRRVYAGYNDIKRLYNGIGVYVVSTSHGIITDRKVRELKCGGEVLCAIW